MMKNNDRRTAYDGDEDGTMSKKDDNEENEESGDPGKPSYADPRIGEDYESAEGRPV